VSPVELRPATACDADALRDLAQRDSAPVPVGRLLIATSGGRIRAAVSTETGEAIADPFVPSADLVEALRALAGEAIERRRGTWRRTRPEPQPVI
jgi:hypothetical protein